MFSLISLSQDIQDRSINALQATNFFDFGKGRLQILINHFSSSFKHLHIEVYNSFDSELLRSQNVKKDIKTVTFVKLIDFIDEFILHREGR